SVSRFSSVRRNAAELLVKQNPGDSSSFGKQFHSLRSLQYVRSIVLHRKSKHRKSKHHCWFRYILSAALIAGLPGAWQAEAKNEELIRQYEGHNYRGAMEAAVKSLQENKRDAVAHYMLANILVELNKLTSARREYMQAIEYGKGTETEKYARKALLVLQKRLGNSFLDGGSVNRSSQVNVSGSDEVDSSPATPYEHVDKFERKVAKQTAEKKVNILKEINARLVEKKRHLEFEYATIESEGKVRMEEVPKYVYSRSGRRIKNPDYDGDVAAIKKETEEKQSAVQNKIRDLEANATAEAHRRVNAITDMSKNLSGQYEKGSETFRMTPQGSSLFVRNYINFDGDRPREQRIQEMQGKVLKLDSENLKRAKP
ncbi:MAG: hypothetical protein K2Z81_20365, partial [Cyanobacteria bacterium]|nr:hypothetical protein [Cyanobacteriota bacterium]